MLSELLAYWLGRSSGVREGRRQARSSYPRDVSYYVAQRVALIVVVLCIIAVIIAYAIVPG